MRPAARLLLLLVSLQLGMAIHGRELKPEDEVVFYPTMAWRAGTGWVAEVHASVFELKPRPVLMPLLRSALGIHEAELGPQQIALFHQRARDFLADNERGRDLTIDLAGRRVHLKRSPANGHVRSLLVLTDAEVKRAAGLSNRLALHLVADNRPVPAAGGEIQLVSDTGWSVISDIDDTIKISVVSNRHELLLNTFCREFRAVPGMAELYRSCARQTNVVFHYVSASPWQLYRPLGEFVEKERFPKGTFHLKQFRVKDTSFFDLFTSPERYKTETISVLLERFPHRQFVLVGDSGEKDPEAYGALARKYPKQVARILIRDVSGEATTAPRYRQAFRDVPAGKWMLFKNPAAVPANFLSGAADLKSPGEANPKDAPSSLKAVHLRCEYLENPLGIDTLKPQLGWLLESSGHNQRQSAYQVLVASTPERLAANRGDLWDSGRVTSDESVHVVYAGQPLGSRARCWWKVRVWDATGKPSDWSEPASWEMGLLEPKAWQARWIGSGPITEPRPPQGFFTSTNQLTALGTTVEHDGRSTLLRKTFVAPKAIRSARVYVTGLGYYELFCNGQRVGDQVLNPAVSNYRQWVYYDTYDLTAQLRRGTNALGLSLGNGWYNSYPKWWDVYRMPWFGAKRALLQLQVEYVDGSGEVIVSDGSWRISPGPVVAACVYDGETYDATLEQPGWDTPEFNAAAWQPAEVMEAPGGELVAQSMPPIRVVKTLRPVSVTEPKAGVYVFDLGQNFAGWVRLKATGPRGTRLTLRYAEDLSAHGTLDLTSNERALATDVYVMKGGGPEVYEPRFTFHGFRFVEVTGYPGRPTVGDLKGCVVHTDARTAGLFAPSPVCSPVISRIHKATEWAQRSNLMGYPMDCPQRDERLGWFGDAMVSMEEAMYNFELPAFYRLWLDGVRRSQNPTNGDISIISPRPYVPDEPDPTWSSAYLVMNWQYYVHYGDRRFLESQFDAMCRYVDYLGTQATNHILPKYWIGDWGTIVEGWKEGEPVSVATAFYYYDCTILARAARVLGRPQDAEKYQRLADEIKAAYQQAFYDPQRHQYEQGTLFSNAFPLFLGLPEPADRPAILTNILATLERRQGHFEVGVLGAKYLIDALTDQGRADVAFKLATQTGHPSWAHMLEDGRTTLSEFWDLHGSHNHVMMGSIDGWFYRVLAGIQPDPERPGFRHIVIKPFIPEPVDMGGAGTETLRGPIILMWGKQSNTLDLTVRIPVNTTATVQVPAAPEALVECTPPARPVRREAGAAVFQIGSGEWQFRVTPVEAH
jgi:alpha-L-rhamnosidase